MSARVPPSLCARRWPIAASLVAAALLLAACGTVADRPRPVQPARPAPGDAATDPGPGFPPVGDYEPAPRSAEPAPPPEPKHPHRVGVLLPLSGPNAAVGRALLDAAQMALFDQGEQTVVLLPRDTGGSPEGAAAAAADVLANGANVILGPLFSQSVAAVAPLARAKGVNVISFSNDSAVAGDGVFLLGFTPSAQVDRVVGLAISRGITRFAVLAPESPYGRAVVNAFSQSVGRYNATLVQAATYPTDMTDLSPVVRQFARYDARRTALEEQRRELAAGFDAVSREALRRLESGEETGDVGFEAVLLPEGGTRLRALAPLFPYFDVDPKRVRFLGTGLWDEPGLGGEPALVGAWFASAPAANTRRFSDRFEATYGRKPPRIASLGYDGLALIAALAREAADNPFSREALGDASGFVGYNGIFRFGRDGTAERGLAVIEVRPNGFREIDTAPRSFQTPIN